MLRKFFASSRYLILIAIVGTLLISFTLLIFTGISVVNIIIESFTHIGFTAEEGKHLAVESIQMIDLFLLGAVLYIISLGLYELFIDDNLKMPRWLTITNLEDLEIILINVITVLLAVTFLGNVVTWDGSQNILWLGIAVGLILLAIGLLNKHPARARQPEREDENTTE